MRNLLPMIGVLLLTAASASAQADYPRVEVFGGYSYLNSDLPNGDRNNVDRAHLNGWAFGLAYNPHRNIGFVGELSGHYGELGLSGIGPTVNSNVHTFLFGPRISLRGDRLSLFSHALAGAARTKLEGLDADTGFALAIGGGIDFSAGRRIAIRALQIDYLPVRQNGDWHRNGRVQAGLVLRLGAR